MTVASRGVVGGIALVMIIAMSCRFGEAAEWSAEPSFTLRGDFNSNLLLTPGQHDPVWGMWESPGVKFGGSTESLQVSGRAAAEFVQYYGESDQKLTNLYFPLLVQYTTSRETFGFDGGFTRDNTLMGEARQTGVVLSFTQRNLWNLAPSWTHALTERLSLQAGYQYSKASYENGLQLGLVDYTVHSGSGGIQYQATEVDQISFTGSFTKFHAPQSNDLVSDISTGQISLTHNFSETISGTLAGGVSYVHSTVQPPSGQVSDDQTLGIGNANLKKTWDDAYVQLEVSRQINPSGFGFLIQTDKVGMTLSKDITERWATSLNAFALWSTGITSKATPPGTFFPQNRYVNINPRVTWKFSQWGQIDFMYTYVHRHIEVSTNDTAFANIASIMLTYTPPKLTVGR